MDHHLRLDAGVHPWSSVHQVISSAGVDLVITETGVHRVVAGSRYPKAVACLRADLDDLLTCFRYPTLEERKAVRTTNAIGRRFREVRRPTRPTATFQDQTSMDRIPFAVFIHENRNQGLATPFALTHTS